MRGFLAEATGSRPSSWLLTCSKSFLVRFPRVSFTGSSSLRTLLRNGAFETSLPLGEKLFFGASLLLGDKALLEENERFPVAEPDFPDAGLCADGFLEKDLGEDGFLDLEADLPVFSVLAIISYLFIGQR